MAYVCHHRHHHHCWLAPLECVVPNVANHPPEWAVLSHIKCLSQYEVVGFQVILCSLELFSNPPPPPGGSTDSICVYSTILSFAFRSSHRMDRQNLNCQKHIVNQFIYAYESVTEHCTHLYLLFTWYAVLTKVIASSFSVSYAYNVYNCRFLKSLFLSFMLCCYLTM